MTEDHRELIESVRDSHQVCRPGLACSTSCGLCHACHRPHPCGPARLATALEQATRPDSPENHRTSCEACDSALAAAERRAAELEQQVEDLLSTTRVLAKQACTRDRAIRWAWRWRKVARQFDGEADRVNVALDLTAARAAILSHHTRYRGLALWTCRECDGSGRTQDAIAHSPGCWVIAALAAVSETEGAK